MGALCEAGSGTTRMIQEEIELWRMGEVLSGDRPVIVPIDGQFKRISRITAQVEIDLNPDGAVPSNLFDDTSSNCSSESY